MHRIQSPPRSEMFAYVKRMNEAFGNRAGNPLDFDPMPDILKPKGLHYDGAAWGRLQKQCENIAGKWVDVPPVAGEHVVNGFNVINGEARELLQALAERNVLKVRDALCDIMVFALGAYHFLGYDADADMLAVLDGVMTRFCRNGEDYVATLAKWEAKGVPLDAMALHGEFPTACVKLNRDVTADGEDMPAGKFLKSASYTEPVFPPAPVKASVNVGSRTFFGKPAALQNLPKEPT